MPGHGEGGLAGDALRRGRAGKTVMGAGGDRRPRGRKGVGATDIRCLRIRSLMTRHSAR